MITIIRSLGLDSSRRRQSGQLLPIAAVVFLLMCGLAGLAIDSSRDYLVKRQAQNAADFATLGAAKQLSLSGSVSGPLAPNSNPVKVAHDFAANNGFATVYSNACDSSGASFTATWFDVAGLPCNATTGFTSKVTINSPPIGFAGYPAPAACSGPGRFACLQVVITTGIPQLFTSILGIPTAYVSVAATAEVTLPASAFSTPPPNALILYQPQAGCNTTAQQCFDETKAVGRAQLSCTGTNNCPTFWSTASVSINGFDGVTLTPPSDLTALQSNGDMVIQQRTTICDPYNGAACARNAVVGARGFATSPGSNLYCQKFGAGASILTPCTTTGQAGLQELDASQTFFSPQYYWTPPTVDTSGLSNCGSLVLNGGPVGGPCANAQEPYSIDPGRYGSIVINHGTYEFGTGLFDIVGSATVNNITGSGYTANGIDHSRETAADFDLCSGGQPNSCPNLTAGVWIGHGGGAFGAYVPPTSGTCIGSVGGGSSGGGGDATIVSGSGVVFRLESGAGGFVSTNEVQGLTLFGAGVGALAAVGGSPLLFDNENSTFIHVDARASSNNLIAGVVYQAPGAVGGGVEMNLGMTSGGGNSALVGQILAYSFTAFGQTGTMDFRNGYGTSSLPGIATSGKNEPSIINSVSLAATVGQLNYSTLTINYTDEWSMDAFDTYLKVNNGSPIFFSQGIWNTTPGPGSPLPPPGNNPGDQYPAYPSSSGAYTIISTSPPDWVYNIPNSGGASIEVKGSWTWGHESDISSARGNYTAQILYTFPNPSGNYVAISVFTTDGDHCGDYDIANYTFRNTGQPGGGTQTVGSVSLVQ